MHAQVKGFIERMKVAFPRTFAARKILEAGSLDINGSPRSYFDHMAEYIGVDWRVGPGVDEVANFEHWRGREDGHFDFAISTEMMEHNPEWEAAVRRMVELVGVGGSVLITCAGPGRPVHEKHTSPSFVEQEVLIDRPAGVYYENRSALDLLKPLLSAGRFANVIIEDEPGICDTRIFAVGKLAEPC